MPYLDGFEVSDAIITPALHRFVGTFRTPRAPDAQGAGVMVCGCGHYLKYFEEVYDHWQRGHFDKLQYTTLREKP